MSTKHDTAFALRATFRRFLGWALFPAVLALTPSAFADEASIEARLNALESQLKTVQAENLQLRQALGLSDTPGVAVAKPAGKASALTVAGILQVQAEFGDKGDPRFGSANDRFYLRRARLGVSGRLIEGFDFKVEGEFANSLAGGATGASSSMTDGYINWNHFNWANVKVGQFKTPFGYEFITSAPKLFTAERTLGMDMLSLKRQIGVQVGGDVFAKRLSYAGGLFNGTGANVSVNDNGKFLYIGRVSGVPWQGTLLAQTARWSVGADGYTSIDNGVSVAPAFGTTGKSFTGKRKGVGVDTQFHLGRLDLWTEYLSVQFDPSNQVPAARFTSDAWYLQGSYFILPKTLQGVVRYDTFTPNHSLSANSTDSWTLGMNWLIKGDDLKFQLDYLLTNPPADAAQQHKLILRSQVIF